LGGGTNALNGTASRLTYCYDNMGNRKWSKREDGTGDMFGYDYADQVTAVKLDIPNPDTTSVGPQTILYDANGNRTSFSPYGTTDTYAINNLNQYTSRNTINNAVYDNNGNLWTGLDDSAYTYDAQDRLLTASKGGVTYAFKYDGLNRQVSRTVGVNGPTTYSVWDGWDLIEEYQAGGSITAAYLYGPSGLVKNLVTNNYYLQDGRGSTSHLLSSVGALLEWYRYDLQGTPMVNGQPGNT
jgi:YD repeat-containing protein